MFRWTAGTKARADRAARQHGLGGGGPRRLLLASRPPHAPQSTFVSITLADSKAGKSRKPSPLHSTMPADSCGSSLHLGDGVEHRKSSVIADTIQKRCSSDASTVGSNGSEKPVTDAAVALLDVQQGRVTLPHEAACPRPLSPSPTTYSHEAPSPSSCVNKATRPPPTVPSPQVSTQKTLDAQQTSTTKKPLPSQSVAPGCSLSQAERLVYAMMMSPKQGRKRCRVHQSQHQHHCHASLCGAAASSPFRERVHQVLGSISDTDSVKGALESWSDERNSAVDTYDLIQREQRNTEIRRRQNRSFSEDSLLTERGSMSSTPKINATRRRSHGCGDGKLSVLVQNCKGARDKPRAPRPDAVSLDCVSVQLPLRGQAGASFATAVTASTRPITQSKQLQQKKNTLSSARSPHYCATQQQPGNDERRNCAAFASSWPSGSGAGEQNKVTTTQGNVSDETTLMQVTAGVHLQHGGVDGVCSERNAVHDDRVLPVDMSLFQGASTEPPALSTLSPSPSRADAFMSLAAGTYESLKGDAGPGSLPWTANEPSDRSYLDLEDRPLAWSLPPLSQQLQPSEFYNALCCPEQCDETVNLSTLLSWHGKGRWTDAAPPLPQRSVSTEWLFGQPEIAHSFNYDIGWATGKYESSRAHDADAFSPQHRRCDHSLLPDPVEKDPWAAPSQFYPHYSESNDRAWSRHSSFSLPFSTARMPGVLEPIIPFSNLSLPVPPCLSSPLRHHQCQHQQQNEPWASPQRQQQQPHHLRQQQERTLPLTSILRSRQRNSMNFAQQLSSGNRRAVRRNDNGGQGRRRRQAPSRALNETTGRCRRFWERCRLQSDIQPSKSSRFF